MNSEALEDSWRQHAAGVRQLLRDLLGDPHAADDVVQETWLTALRRQPRAGWSWPAWLRGIAVHRARYVVRSERRRKAHETKLHRPSAAEEVPPLERFEQIELVVEALRQLSPRNREIVLLRYYEDLTPTAISERLSLPLATVKSRLQRSLVELRRRLEGRAFPAWFWLGGVSMSFQSKSALVAALLVIGSLTAVAWFAEPWLAREALEAGSLTVVADRAQGHASTSAGAKATRVDPESQPPDPSSVLVSRTDESDIRVQLVERDTQRPVPGAEVFLFDDRKLLDDPTALYRRGFLLEDDLDRHQSSLVKRLVSDAQGEVRIPPSIEWARIGARHGELWGQTGLSPYASNPVRLEMEVDRSVRVRVVDAAGVPRAGVAVGVRSDPSHSFGGFYFHGTTGPDGIYEFRHLQREPLLWSGRGTYGVSFAFPLQDPPFVKLDPEAAARTEVELELPPTACVQLELLGEDEQPLRSPAFVGLSFEPTQIMLENEIWMARTLSTQGLTRFENCGLGLALTAHLFVPGREFCTGVLEFEGPTRAGEILRVSMRVGPRYPALVGTLVDENDAPIRNLVLRAYRTPLGMGNAPGDGEALELRDDGRFRHALDPVLLARGMDGIELISSQRADGTDPQRMWLAQVPLPEGASEPGDHDIGKIVLRSTPPLAAGVIVDGAGAPLPAQLFVERLWTDLERDEWREQSGCMISIVQRNGEFSLYGNCAAGELRLRAERRGFLQADPVPFARGESGLRLVLQTAPSIEGSVLLDAGVPHGALQVRLSGTAVPPPARSLLATLDGAGRFGFRDLRAGSASLRICLPLEHPSQIPPDSANVTRIDGLELRAGAACADARLQEIDLRGLLRSVKLRVLDEAGIPLASATIAHRGSGRMKDPWFRSTTASDGTAALLSTSLPIDVHAGKPGYRMLEVPQIDGDQELRLLRGIAVTIEIAGVHANALDGAELMLTVHGAEQPVFTPGTAVEEMQRLAATQRNTLGLPEPIIMGVPAPSDIVLPGPGEYTAEVRLRRRGERGGFLTIVARNSFVVGEEAEASAKVRVEVSAEKLRNAIRGPG
ncbi:MAG: RNA polymerase sigma factor [Planctomycetes bacterium]|nr:RNA polymerase sigma factor [Planctomycetota bacterium]